jgi:hypothetical protein
VLRSVAGVVLPSAVLLAGCPQKCAPTPPAPPAVAPPPVAHSPGAPAPPPAPPTTSRPEPPITVPSRPPPAGVKFSEDFSTTAAFYNRFDRGWSGQDPATWPVNAGPVLSWLGDHDMSCSDPNATSRTIAIAPGAAGKEGVFYPCLPGGDPAKGHVMTSVNTVGYNIIWFSPKQYFTNVTRVCWDQNLTDEGGGKWTQVVLVARADAERVDNDLGFVGPGFEDPNGPSTSSFPSPATGGAKMFRGGFEVWRGVASGDGNAGVTGEMSGGQTTADKAARFQHCMVDNNNGTITLTQARPNGTVATQTVSGDLPNGDVRVVFEDDTYNADKHFDDSLHAGPNHTYTWHWDNIQIT